MPGYSDKRILDGLKRIWKDTIWLVDLLFILVNPGIIVIPPYTLIILIGKTFLFVWREVSFDWLWKEFIGTNQIVFKIIHHHKDSRSVTHNWPTYDKWRIWEHDHHYFHMCQEKQVFCVMFLLFIYNVYVNSSYINNLHNSLVPSWSWWDGSWISVYLCNQCLSSLKLWVRIPLRRCELGTTLCDKICQWLATGLVFSTYNTDRHDMTEILLK